MCYAYPGPRCSSYAKKKMQSTSEAVKITQLNYDNALSQKLDDTTVSLCEDALFDAKEDHRDALSDYHETSEYKKIVNEMWNTGLTPHGKKISDKRIDRHRMNLIEGQDRRGAKMENLRKKQDFLAAQEFSNADPYSADKAEILFAARRNWYATSPGSEETMKKVKKLVKEKNISEAKETEMDLAHAMLYKKYQREAEFSRTTYYTPEQEEQEKVDASRKATQHIADALSAQGAQ